MFSKNLLQDLNIDFLCLEDYTFGMDGVTTGGGAVGDMVGDLFDIPEQQIVEQAEEAFTIGDTGKIDNPTSDAEVWNPLADF